MPKLALVAALEREIAPLIKKWTRTPRDHQGRTFTFFEHDNNVAVCGGIGLEPARRATEAVIALYHPTQLRSVGFAGALRAEMHVGDIFSPAVAIDARDGSRVNLEGGEGALVTFMAVADAEQKSKLASAYGARAVDMEAAAVAAAARVHGITFGATKVISDGLDFDIPGMARFINSEGQFRTADFVLFAALRPWLWKSVATLARNSSKAARALSWHLERFCRDMATAENSAAVAVPASASPARGSE
jgi:adenosylhomocysteine nucleosidase